MADFSFNHTEYMRVIRALDDLRWILPSINPNIGKVEPGAKYKRDGLCAYADGINWKPNGTGAKGLWRWNAATLLWDLVG